jgi:putative transcriptional regulator
MTGKRESDHADDAEYCVELKPLEAQDVRAIRMAYGLSQPEFSRKFGIPLSTLRKWEQGDHHPSSAAVSFLHSIAK